MRFLASFFLLRNLQTHIFFDNYQVCTYPLLHVLIFPKIVNFDESTGRLISIFYFYQIFIKDISSGTCSLQSLIKSNGLIGHLSHKGWYNQFCCLRQGVGRGESINVRISNSVFTWKACLRVASS